MSNNLDQIFDAQRSLAKKRLANELHILVGGQVIAWFIAIQGLPCCTGWTLLSAIGITACYGLAFWVFARLGVHTPYYVFSRDTSFITTPIQNYARLGLILFFALLLMLVPPKHSSGIAHYPYRLQTFAYISLIAFLLYAIVPQFFIARWLAKE